MPSSTPFVDPATGDIDTGQILSEAIPLGKLIVLFVALSLIPFSLVFLALGNSIVGAVLVAVTQLILAVGTGIALIYVIARGIQLSNK